MHQVFLLLLSFLLGRGNNVSNTHQEKIDNTLKWRGKYNNLSLAIDSNVVSGAYQYYDGWDERYKTYTKVNSFMFRSVSVIGKNEYAISSWDSDSSNIIKGRITLYVDSGIMIRLCLEDQPYGYSDIDFTELPCYEAQLTESKNWKGIGKILSDKAYLHKSQSNESVTRTYVIKDDIVKIIAVPEDSIWVKIEYSPINSSKVYIGYIRKELAVIF